MVVSANLGFPRIGLKRELKKAQEAYWKGKSSQEELLEIAKDMRARHWKLQQEAGIEHIPSNDFSLYSDALSGPDGPAPTYLDMMRHNATTLAQALSY